MSKRKRRGQMRSGRSVEGGVKRPGRYDLRIKVFHVSKSSQKLEKNGNANLSMQTVVLHVMRT